MSTDSEQSITDSAEENSTVHVSRNLDQTVEKLFEEKRQIEEQIQRSPLKSRSIGSPSERQLKQRVRKLRDKFQQIEPNARFSAELKNQTIDNLVDLLDQVEEKSDSSSTETESDTEDEKQRKSSKTGESESSDGKRRLTSRKVDNQLSGRQATDVERHRSKFEQFIETDRESSTSKRPQRRSEDFRPPTIRRRISSSNSTKGNSSDDDSTNQRKSSIRPTPPASRTVSPVDSYSQRRRQRRKSKSFMINSSFIGKTDSLGEKPGFLTVRAGDRLELIKMSTDENSYFYNVETKRRGFVPMENVEFRTSPKQIQTIEASKSLIQAWIDSSAIPQGFSVAKLQSLSLLNEYKIYSRLIPERSSSNFSSKNLFWRNDQQKLVRQAVDYQRILKLKSCSHIPTVDPQQLKTLQRSLRICLSDGAQVLSNIVNVRAYLGKERDRGMTEDWRFDKTSKEIFYDQINEYLIRTNRLPSEKTLYLIVELSILCESLSDQRRCVVSCGWTRIQISYNRSQTFNELINAGIFDEEFRNINEIPRTHTSHGTFGKLHRHRRARIQFSLDRVSSSRNLNDYLPPRTIIVPMTLRFLIAFFRHELASQVFNDRVKTDVRTAPTDSIFLNTFERFIENPAFVYSFHNYFLSSGRLKFSEQRPAVLEIYQTVIYSSIFHQNIPQYIFDDPDRIKQIIDNLNTFISGSIHGGILDPLSIFLDEKLTEFWAPLTAHELIFSFEQLMT